MREYKITFTKNGFQKNATMSGYGVSHMLLAIIKENYEAIVSTGFEISINGSPLNHQTASLPSLYKIVKGSYPCIWELKDRPQWSKVKEDLDQL